MSEVAALASNSVETLSRDDYLTRHEYNMKTILVADL